MNLQCSCCYRRYQGGRYQQGSTSAYRAWANMKCRCTNEKHSQYQDYGGRGITVCDRWDDFDAFFEDMGHPPPGLSLDRIDNDGNYEPTNCRWATIMTQVNNQRVRKNTHFVTYEGTTLSLSDWARLIRMPQSTLDSRISRGWSTERALFT